MKRKFMIFLFAVGTFCLFADKAPQSFEQKFQTPESVHYPAYFWFWNGKLTKEQLISQLEDMYRMGARSVCPHPLPAEFRKFLMTKMSPGYLTPAYFQLYKEVIKRAAELGMNSYLYDEGGWPSGGACGQVFAKDPVKFRRHFMEPGPNGTVKITKEPLPIPGNCPRANSLVPESVDLFLKMTHHAYQKHVGKHFGKTIRFAFTDEPELGPLAWGGIPWIEGFEEEFLKRKGYDIRPYLPAVVRNRSVNKEMVEKRLDCYEVLSQLFVERFLLPLRETCRKMGLVSTGHFGGEDEWHHGFFKIQGFGQLLTSLRALDAPGVDLIWRQLESKGRLHPFPKLASSAANQVGSAYVLAEMFGVYGQGISFDEMKFLLDYMYVCGVNTFVFCAYPYTTEGGMMEGERPHFGKMNPLWKYMPGLHQRVAHLSAAFTNAKPVVKAAVFFDIRSLWVGERVGEYSMVNQVKLAEDLLESQCDFDYIDDEVLAKGVMKNGKLCFGKAVYDCVIFPRQANLSKKARENLPKLKKQGLRVMDADESELIEPLLQVRPATRRLRVRKMDAGNGKTLYFVLNTSGQKLKVTLEAGEKQFVSRCDPADGKIYAVAGSGKGKWQWEFSPYDSALFLLSSRPATLPAPAAPGKAVMTLEKGWTLKPLIQYTVGQNNYEVHPLTAGARQTVPGDLRKVLGEAFSGEVLYRNEFVWDGKNAPRFIDLGDMRFAATVTLNGKELGKALFSPFILPLGNALRKGKNVLEITVANTLANAISPKEVLERWKKQFPMLCTWEIKQRDFESESLESGLFGPVRLLTEKK